MQICAFGSRFVAQLHRCTWVLFLVSGGFWGCQHAPMHGSFQALRRSVAQQAILQTEIQALVASYDPNLHIGIHVVGANDGQTILAYNPHQRFVPASTLKILTAAASLSILGPAHRFVTALSTDAFEKNGKAIHNLYLEAAGDPRLQLGDLAEMAASLRQQGISEISGDILIDDTAFDAVPWGHGWMWDDLAEGYSAPISAINVAGNEIVVQLNPHPFVGKPLRATYTPPTDYISLNNQTVTAPANTPTSLRVSVNNAPPDPMGLVFGQILTLNGTMASTAPRTYKRYAVRDPAVWAGSLLRETLQSQGVVADGFIRRAVVPATAVRLSEHISQPLTEILSGAMKASDNHVMECLLKKIGQQTALAPGNWTNGTQAVRQFLEQTVGLDVRGLVLADGSGSSRYSLITPEQMTQVLRWAGNAFDVYPEFMATLPIGGTDGTLLHRMLEPPLLQHVRAKTGTMTGTSNLAGYVQTADGDNLVFAIFMDNVATKSAELRRLQDAILQRLVRNAPSTQNPIP